MDNEDRQHYSELLSAYQRRLRPLEKQAAHFGVRTDPHVLNEIADIQNEMLRIQTYLASDASLVAPIAQHVTITRSVPVAPLGLESHAGLNLALRLQSLHTLDLVGYDLYRLLREMSDAMLNALQRGAIIRCLIVDQMSVAGQLMQDHSQKPHRRVEQAKSSLKHLQDIQMVVRSNPQMVGRLELRLTSWIPSCNLILIDAYQPTGFAKVGINPLSLQTPLTGRISLLIQRNANQEEFSYFIKQFEALWEESKQWDGTLPFIKEGTHHETA